MVSSILPLLVLLSVVQAHRGGSDQPNPWADEFGQVGDLSFSGATSFAHLPSPKCLDEPHEAFDIALIGIPFDSAVSYRPGTSPHVLHRAEPRPAS
jgi:agmatinase